MTGKWSRSYELQSTRIFAYLPRSDASRSNAPCKSSSATRSVIKVRTSSLRLDDRDLVRPRAPRERSNQQSDWAGAHHDDALTEFQARAADSMTRDRRRLDQRSFLDGCLWRNQEHLPRGSGDELCEGAVALA